METAGRIEDIQDIEALRTIAKDRTIQFEALKKKFEEETRRLNMQLLLKDERIAGLIRDAWARSSEKLTKGEARGQASLFDEAETAVREEAVAGAESGTTIKEHVRKRGKRAPLPAELPRVEETIDISEEEKICGCGAELAKIGEDVSEKLEVIPMRFQVRRTIRPRYACSCCGGTENEPEQPVLVAPVPPSIIPKSNATPSLLASIATWKFQDALPLYRQERIFSRHGIELSRATLSRWILELGDRCAPIVEGIEAHIRAGPMIGMDETPIQVLKEKNRADTSLSYMWVARGGTAGKTGISFTYRPGRSAEAPKEFLATYEGVLQTDGYQAYDAAVKDRPIVLVGCMAHARRQFIKADKSGKIPTSAKAALDHFRKLYAVEREATERGLDADGRRALRQEKARPILSELKAFLDERSVEVPPESLIGQAISYTLGQWEKLARYADYGFVPIDNNLLENAIRPFVIGRKNFLFSGSPDGAESSAALYTIIETAKANGHEPFQYLYFLFSRLPYAKDAASIASLLPFNCTPAEARTYVAHNWLGVGS